MVLVASHTVRIHGGNRRLCLQYKGSFMPIVNFDLDAVRREFWDFMSDEFRSQQQGSHKYTQARANLVIPGVKARALAHLTTKFKHHTWIREVEITILH